MTVPVRRLPLANPSEEKRKARPPARRCAPRQLRPHLRFGQLPRAPCHSHPMTAQFPGLQFCCVNHGKGNEASPAPTWRASCRHLSQRPCCPTAEPFLAFFSLAARRPDSIQISNGAPGLCRTAVRAIKSLDPSAYHIVGHSFLPVFDLYLNQLGSKQWLGLWMQLC